MNIRNITLTNGIKIITGNYQWIFFSTYFEFDGIHSHDGAICFFSSCQNRISVFFEQRAILKRYCNKNNMNAFVLFLIQSFFI